MINLRKKGKIKGKRRKCFRSFFILFISLSVLFISIFYFFEISSNKYCKYTKWMGNNNIEMKKLKSNMSNMENYLNINEPNYRWAEGLYEENNPKVLIYHHAAIKKATVEKIHQIHLDKDYGGIGYHFYIRKDGKIYRGRPENTIGAHTIGKNRDSLGICLEGNLEEENMTEEQVVSLENLSIYLIIKYNIEGVYGHRDFYETACPGKNFKTITIKDNINNKILDLADKNK